MSSSPFDISYLEDLIAHMNLLLNVMYGIVRELNINPRLNIYIIRISSTNVISLVVSNSRVLLYHIAIVEFYFIHEAL